MNFEYMSVPEIMEKIGRKDRDRFNQNYINPALKLGIIERKYQHHPQSLCPSENGAEEKMHQSDVQSPKMRNCQITLPPLLLLSESNIDIFPSTGCFIMEKCVSLQVETRKQNDKT